MRPSRIGDDPAIGIGIVGPEAEHRDPRRLVAARSRSTIARIVSGSRNGTSPKQTIAVAVEPGERLLAISAACAVPSCSSCAAISRPSGATAASTCSRRAPTTTTFSAAPSRIERIDQVEQHRPPGDRVEHLVQVGLHPRAHAGGQDDRGDRVGHRFVISVAAPCHEDTTNSIATAASLN